MNLLYALNRQRLLIISSFLISAIYINSIAVNPENNFLQRIENLAYDIKLRWTLPKTKNEQVVILDIDEKSLAEIGRWPWPRDRLAMLVDTLFSDYQIKVLGFDVVFAEKDGDPGIDQLQRLAKEQLPQSDEFINSLQQLKQQINRDQQFAESLQNRSVVLGYFFQTKNNLTSNQTTGVLPFPVLPIKEAKLEQIDFINNTGFGGNLDILQNNAMAGGYFDNPDTSNDGIFRQIPLVSAYQGNLYESFALAISRVYLDEFFIEPVTTNDADNIPIALEAIKVGEINIPVNRQAMTLIPYLGPQGSFNYYSISDVLNGRISKDKLLNKIVLIGTTSTGLQDLRITPVQAVYPGVEIHANLIAGILDQRIKYKPDYSPAINLFTLIIISLVMTFSLPFLSAVGSILLTVSTTSLLLSFNIFSWQQGLVLPVASGLILIGLLFTFHMTYGFIREARKKHLITRTFSQYVPPDVVKALADNPSLGDLSGQSRDMTVLFSDVRGFTSLSENLSPAELTQVMNSILTPVTRIIYENGGTIDKYMGDAVMAFWGAPLMDDQHHLHALQAAMQITQALDIINQQFAEKNWPSIDMGIGLNSGMMNVGNMGSEYRVAYTVLGDAVNLGSRLEGLTKQYGVRIVVSEFTRKQISGYLFRELDKVRVKGKQEPVTIYEPIGAEKDITSEHRNQIHQYHQALSLYRNQHWIEAEKLFLDLLSQNPHSLLFKLYLQRIKEYRLNAPPENWDGVYTFTTK